MADEANEQQPVQAESEAVIAPAGGAVEPAAAPVNSEVEEPDQDAEPLATDGVAEPAAPAEPEVAFSWQASEYVNHHKSPTWYAALAGIILLLTILAAVLHFWLEIGVFIVMGIALFIYASKPPRVMTYELSNEGVHIEGRLFPYASFRSFSVMQDEDWHSIDLEPTKRFNPRMVLLFDPQDIDEIVGHLELHLSKVDRKPDAIERLTRYLRF